MKNKTISAVVALVVSATTFHVYPQRTDHVEVVTVIQEAQEKGPKISHRQDVWLYALEWCESGGRETAVNPMDLDGTKSYYSFQFKPGTFRMYGERYGILEKNITDELLMEKLKSYELQREIVKNMLFDKSVRWNNEFPDCVKRLGWPPK